MNYILKVYDNNIYDDLRNLILESLIDDKNKTDHNMKRLVDTLPRFGLFNIVYDQNKPIACGGLYISDFDPEFAFIGVRSYVLPEYRHERVIRNYILTAHKQWAIDNNIKAIGISFNDYNKNLLKLWNSSRLGSGKDKRYPEHLFYSNFNEVPFPVKIKNTKQYVAYEILKNWKYDWESIKFYE